MDNISRSNRYHIGIFGRRNAGKSSLINKLTGQDVSIVSDIAGTTTDTVWKNMELPEIGATVIGDTAGYDDEGILGEKRITGTEQVVQRIDLALMLLEGMPQDIEIEKKWKKLFMSSNIPIIYILTKCDTDKELKNKEFWEKHIHEKIIPISAKTGEGMEELLNAIKAIYKSGDNTDDITYSLVKSGDIVILVMPQDKQAPQGRLIQPQVQTLRNLLDKHCVALCCTPQELPKVLNTLTSPPALIITDSQVFKQVAELSPKECKLTSFSILMARHKGDMESFRLGAKTLLNMPENGRILIAEACTHIPQNEDIGRVKLPRMIHDKLGANIKIDIVSGNDFPKDLTQYNLIIHCGACMFTRRHVMSRLREAKLQNVPMTNYGIAIAALTGILPKITF